MLHLHALVVFLLRFLLQLLLFVVFRGGLSFQQMDINPLLATEKEVIAVDARIRIEKGE